MFLRGDHPAISILMPVFQERAMVPELMATLEAFDGLHELILVDGGSTDGTYETLCERGVGQVLRCEKGRARQMNVAARAARGSLLLFLHADTRIEAEGPEMALRAIDRGADAGCFRIRIQSEHRRLRLAGRLQTMRSRLFPSATGDQALFVRRDLFWELGGFNEEMEICEDLDFVRRLVECRGAARFACVGFEVETSGRRWEKNGINRTIALMWAMRLAYHLGVSPERLANHYRPVR